MARRKPTASKKTTSTKTTKTTKLKGKKSAMNVNKMTIQNRIEIAVRAGLNVILWGPPGVGKSHVARQVIKQFAGGEPFAVVVPEDCPVAELRGHFVPTKEGQWRWMDGPVVAAWREKRGLILDELSHASAEAQTWLHQALDDTQFLTLPSGESVEKVPVPVVATMNDDPTKVLRAAMLDRFPVIINMTEPLSDAMQHLRYGKHAMQDAARHSLRRWVALEKGENAGVPLAELCEVIWPGSGQSRAEALELSGKKPEKA